MRERPIVRDRPLCFRFCFCSFRRVLCRRGTTEILLLLLVLVVDPFTKGIAEVTGIVVVVEAEVVTVVVVVVVVVVDDDIVDDG